MNKKSGLSLLEILVALTLVSLIVLVAVNYAFDNKRDNIKQAAFDLEQAIRFASNEAILRGSMTRLRFIPKEGHIEYTIESGPQDIFVLPDLGKQFEDEDNLTIREREKRKKVLEDLAKQFSRIKEFQENDKKLPDGIDVFGVATSLRKNLISNTESHVYFYPSGEKDDAIIIIVSELEVLALEISPFSTTIKRNYYELKKVSDYEETIEAWQRMANTIYAQWRNGK